ncbi:peptide-methionine (S)-S-oxide reductase [Longispora albida]|uniref:peptide-methionine (S)-S-oxide reductase n=1 Tax=Longispora albida TaxID=203523 RepID=UPI00037C0E17|nr:peptide-methionine (S)-S-oxide reductase [Longispora albida]
MDGTTRFSDTVQRYRQLSINVLWVKAEDYHQQYLDKNPGGYCNHGPNGLTCPVGVAKTAEGVTALPQVTGLLD